MPKDEILESVYKRKLSDSEHLKTKFALCNQDTVQKNEPTSYTCEKYGQKVFGSGNERSKYRCQ